VTVAALFVVGGTAIAALCLLLSLAIVARRALRDRALRRERALAEPYRQLLVALVVDDDVDPAHLATLVGLDAARWAALEPVVVSMVRKLRGEAREVLVELLDQRGTIERLTRRLGSRGAVRRARSAELLGLLGEHAPRGELERLLVSDRDAEVRIVAARALGEVGDPASAAALLGALSGTHAVPMRIVARSLARLGPGAAPALVEAMTSAEAPARAVAAEILGLGGAVTAVGVLSSHALRDPDDEVRIRCARALGRIGVPSALSVLRRCVQPEEPSALRAVAARAVGDVGGAEAVRVLRPLLADPEHRVATNAARALAGLGAVGLEVLQQVVDAREAGASYAAEALAVRELLRPRASTLAVPAPRGASVRTAP
jgi:HEAT repeat protein